MTNHPEIARVRKRDAAPAGGPSSLLAPSSPSTGAAPKLRVLDLFCGAAGGWSLGLHRTGAFETVAACEIDDWRRAIFARNFPATRMYADVRELDADRLRADGIVADIVVGSPPCQDASTANANGKGVDGERTGLFFDAVRLVRELRPRWACFENVPGLRTRGYDRVHDALEAAGYTVRPLVVGAWHAGAPHRRNRVWIVANAAEIGCGARWAGRLDPGFARQPQQTLHDADAPVVLRPAFAWHQPDGLDAGAAAEPARQQMGRAGQSRSQAERVPSDTDETRLAVRESLGSDDGTERQAAERNGLCVWDSWNSGAPEFGGVDDGLPKGMARHMLSAYGDAVVPQIPELIGRAILHAEGLL